MTIAGNATWLLQRLEEAANVKSHIDTPGREMVHGQWAASMSSPRNPKQVL